MEFYRGGLVVVTLLFIFYNNEEVLGVSQHRVGYFDTKGKNEHAHAPLHFANSHDILTTRSPSPTITQSITGNDGPLGYIILSMKDSSNEDYSSPLPSKPPTTTARVIDITPQLYTPHTISDILSNSDNLDEKTNTFHEKSINNSSPDSSTKFMFGGFMRREIWTIPLVSFMTINLFLIILFEIYVLCQARGQSPLFLGQFLLLGLFLLSVLSAVFIIPPSELNCYLGRVGIGVSYALVFSVLMVKSVFLISLEAGINLPVAYQGTLLLFALLVQIVLGVQSSVIYPSSFFTILGQDEEVLQTPWQGSFWVECGADYNEMLYTVGAYNGFLILLVGVLALKTRKIRDNYRESTYIGFSILATVPIWASWVLASWVLQGKDQDACIAFGCQLQSLSTFLIMFMPKGRQLAAMGEGGKLLEDNQDDEYSPSFFHFKPGKYYKTPLFNDPNLYTTLEPTISTINPNVYFHRTDFHPGMIY